MSRNNKKSIVIGASSGIGRALAKELGHNGYEVGLVARRIELLRKLADEISTQTYIKRIDISQAEQAMSLLYELIEEMGGMDLIVLNSGINTWNINLDWKGERDILDVNVRGFVAMANVAVHHFETQRSGHIVGISSIACLRGSAVCSSYNASKAFVSNYLQGLRYRFRDHNIYVTDIRPGLVDTDLIRCCSRKFWVATCEKAAEQIFRAIKRKKKVAYITSRWWTIAQLAKLLPDSLYCLRYKR
jgi:short-subunit dehydrogenase